MRLPKYAIVDVNTREVSAVKPESEVYPPWPFEISKEEVERIARGEWFSQSGNGRAEEDSLIMYDPREVLVFDLKTNEARILERHLAEGMSVFLSLGECGERPSYVLKVA